MVRDLPSRSLPNPELGAVQLGCSDRHDDGADGWTCREDCHVTGYGVHGDGSANEGEGFRVGVHPGCAIQIVVHRSVGDDLPLRPANLLITHRGRLDAEPFGCLCSQYQATEILPDRLDPGWWVAFLACCRLSTRHKL